MSVGLIMSVRCLCCVVNISSVFVLRFIGWFSRILCSFLLSCVLFGLWVMMICWLVVVSWF